MEEQSSCSPIDKRENFSDIVKLTPFKTPNLTEEALLSKQK